MKKLVNHKKPWKGKTKLIIDNSIDFHEFIASESLSKSFEYLT